MSVIRKPDENGVSEVLLGGEGIGTIRPGDGVFVYVSPDGLCKGEKRQRNLAVKKLVMYHRSIS